MQIVDPNNLPQKEKKARALKGGEPFSAEPELTEASEKWKKAQHARLLLRNEASRAGTYGNAWPTLDAVQDYFVSETHNTYQMEWDDEVKRYCTKNYYKFQVKYRYYRGERSKSYLFWPAVVVPGYALLRQNFPAGTVEVATDTGTATYVRVGTMEGSGPYGRDQEVWALWKSEGTMKARRTKNAQEEDTNV